MTSPKHLWSGDWQQDAAAAARERARRQAAAQQPLQAPAAPPPVTGPSAASGLLAAARARLVALRPSRPVPALLVALVALLIAAGAFGVTRLTGSGHNSHSPATGPLSTVGPGGSASTTANHPTPWLGVNLESLPVDRVMIAAVVPGGPADQAGLGPGDVITHINHRPIGVPGDVAAAIAGQHPGDKAVIEVQRGPDTYTTQATLVGQPPNYP